MRDAVPLADDFLPPLGCRHHQLLRRHGNHVQAAHRRQGLGKPGEASEGMGHQKRQPLAGRRLGAERLCKLGVQGADRAQKGFRRQIDSVGPLPLPEFEGRRAAASASRLQPAGQAVEELLLHGGVMHGVKAGRLDEFFGDEVRPFLPKGGKASFGDGLHRLPRQRATLATQAGQGDAMQVQF